MMNLFIILYEFTKIGLFAVGGGYATLPFLYHLIEKYHLFNPNDLTQMLAISSIMPGPIGINLAAQTGFKVAAFAGAIMAIVGIMIPSLIFVLIVSKILKEFEGNIVVKSVFYVLKPTCCGMVAAIGLKLLKDVIFVGEISFSLLSIDWFALVLFSSLLILSFKKQFSPIFYLGVSALIGVLVYFVKQAVFF